MIDWNLTPENQVLYERVVAQNRRLQAALGIQPLTIEDRAEIYQQKKIEDARRQQELKELEKRIGRSRPLPKWKV